MKQQTVLLRPDYNLKFTFWQKVRILFGKKVTFIPTIEIDRNFKLLKNTGMLIVEPFRKHKFIDKNNRTKKVNNPWSNQK